MTELTRKKMAVSVAMISLTILFGGSMITGATFLTSAIRGVEAALIFGALFWLLGMLLVVSNDSSLVMLISL